jgi:hypothetical protein
MTILQKLAERKSCATVAEHSARLPGTIQAESVLLLEATVTQVSSRLSLNE